MLFIADCYPTLVFIQRRQQENRYFSKLYFGVKNV